MFMATHLVGFGASAAVDLSLYGAITANGLTGNLQLCLDAGDVSSYTGSGQSWLDRSGNGYDFYRGAGSGSEASDPTFNGTAGALTSSEYFSVDGGDWFTYDSANETWMQNLHKDNAAYTILAILYPGAVNSYQDICGTGASSAETGFDLAINGSAKFYLEVDRSSAGSPAITKTSDSSLSATTWQFLAVSLNEATGLGGGFLWRNGAYLQVGGADTFNSTYTSPSTGSAAGTFQIGARGGTQATPLLNGSRIAGFAAWSTALTKAQLDSIYSQLASRFGL